VNGAPKKKLNMEVTERKFQGDLKRRKLKERMHKVMTLLKAVMKMISKEQLIEKRVRVRKRNRNRNMVIIKKVTAVKKK
jgi:hypothetical protein